MVVILGGLPGESETTGRYLVEGFAQDGEGWKQWLAGDWYIISAALDSTCSLHLLRVCDGKSAGMGRGPTWNGMVFETGVFIRLFFFPSISDDEYFGACPPNRFFLFIFMY